MALTGRFKGWWLTQSPLKPMSGKDFGKRAERRWRKDHTKRGNVYYGVELLPEDTVKGEGKTGTSQNFSENFQEKTETPNDPSPFTQEKNDTEKAEHAEETPTQEMVKGEGTFEGSENNEEISKKFWEMPSQPSPFTDDEEGIAEWTE